MTSFKRFAAATAAALTFALAAAAPAHSFQFAPTTVDVEKMRKNLVAALKGKTVGYGYAITRNGVLVKAGGGGYARRHKDGKLSFNSKRRMEVMSVTKNVTAVGVLRLLEQNNLSIDTPVAGFLPASWSKGPGFSGSGGVTFRHLLTHTSGLNQEFKALDDTSQWGNDWKGLEWVVANGTTPGSAHSYKNANYALFRVLIPALWRELDPSVPVVTEGNSWALTLGYLQQNLFTPSGIGAVTCWPANTAKAPLAYSRYLRFATGKLVQMSGSQAGGCGGHRGLHLSARDLVRFQVQLRYTQTLLSSQARAQMDSLKLGWSNSSNGSATAGTQGKYWHGGDGYWGKGRKRRELHVCVMKLPAGVEASLLVNSKIGNGKSQCTILRTAFDEAL
jgi:CubicO group peptidase (beta-lactamase class C family)